ncbi:phage portal protein, partial [Staphylococcus pseudintermedius]|nr:phage portal protein [Staphylococcus pseudintermedius]
MDLDVEEVKKMRKSRIILAKTKADSAGRMGNANVDFI